MMRKNRRRDSYAVEQSHARVLAEILWKPIRYNQRFVERLAFAPTGGQCWNRALQIRIPTVVEPEHTAWRIVPLGQYARRRLADITVEDANGKRLNLLTRHQHGQALSKALLGKHLLSLPKKYRKNLNKRPAAYGAYTDLQSRLYDFFTEVGDTPKQADVVFRNTNAYTELLKALGVSVPTSPEDNQTDLSRLSKGFADDFARLAESTQYLCWVEAASGEVINLMVSYTTKDPVHDLESNSFWLGMGSVLMDLFVLGRTRLLDIRAKWYREYGLAPMNYAFDIPKHRSTGSYYFTLEAPSQTVVTYLDWEEGDSLREDGEVDCAFPSVHIHNDGGGTEDSVQSTSGIPDEISEISGTIRAYLRCEPHRHKQILGATLLNVALVVLLATGRLPGQLGDPLQGLLIAAPSVLIAFLAQQQRHYYAYVMRRQRAVLWLYLAISVGFLVAVAFSEHEGHVGSSGLGWPATAVAWTLGISSLAVVAWQIPLGPRFDRVVRKWTQRKWDIANNNWKAGPFRTFINDVLHRHSDGEIKTKWECCTLAVDQYCRLVSRLIVLSILGAIFLLHQFWNFPPTHTPTRHAVHAAFINDGVGTTLTKSRPE